MEEFTDCTLFISDGKWQRKDKISPSSPERILDIMGYGSQKAPSKQNSKITVKIKVLFFLWDRLLKLPHFDNNVDLVLAAEV